MAHGSWNYGRAWIGAREWLRQMCNARGEAERWPVLEGTNTGHGR